MATIKKTHISDGLVLTYVNRDVCRLTNTQIANSEIVVLIDEIDDLVKALQSCQEFYKTAAAKVTDAQAYQRWINGLPTPTER